MGDQDYIPMTIEVIGYAGKEDTAFYECAKSAKATRLYTPARCKIWDTGGVLLVTQKTWLDAAADQIRMGQQYKCDILIYEGRATMYTAYQLCPVESKDERDTLSTLKGKEGGQPAAQPQAAQQGPSRAAPPQQETSRTTTQQRATPPEKVAAADGKEAVLILHRQAWKEAGEVVFPEGCEMDNIGDRIRAQAELTKSIIMGWKMDAGLYPAAVMRAKMNREKAALAEKAPEKKTAAEPEPRSSGGGFGSDNMDMPDEPDPERDWEPPAVDPEDPCPF